MSESQKSSPNMPAILVVLLAVFGLGTFPLGGGKVSDSSPKGPESAKPAGDSQDSTDAENEKNLGPLATIMADRVLQPSAEKPDQCLKVKLPQNVFTDSGRDERDELLLSEPNLRFLIALVPEPDGSSMSHEFDLTLSAVQRGTESAGFIAVRWSGIPESLATKNPSPSAPKRAVTHLIGAAGKQAVNLTIEEKSVPPDPVKWPASVLCRATAAEETGAQKTRLLILLVPESPTWGVDKDRFANAVHLVARHGDLHKWCQHTPAEGLPVRIVGPNFSGSVRSMVRVLQPIVGPGFWRSAGPIIRVLQPIVRPIVSGTVRPLFRVFQTITALFEADQSPDIVVYNGRATAAKLEHFENLPNGSVRFQSTIYTNANLTAAVREFAKTITPSWGETPRYAVLIESNTGFGQASNFKLAADADTEYFSFPLNISQIREEYAAKGYLRSSEPLKLQSPERLSPLEMAGPRGHRDLVPVVTPTDSAVDGEIKLSHLLTTLERGHYTWVGINATNAYDRLFLAEKVRVACPNARLFLLNASTLYSHPAAVPYLRGTIVVSTYPLDPETQTWTASPGSRGGNVSRLAFGNHYEEGIYNATVAHIADMGLDDTPNLLDYAFPGTVPTKAETQTGTVPSVWIGVVGQRGIYPLRVRPPDPDWLKVPNKDFPEIGGLYRSQNEAKLPEVPLAGVLDASWVGVFLTAAFASIIVSSWYLWLSLWFETNSTPRWLAWTCVCPGLRQVVDYHSARKLATIGASAGFGQMVLLSAPVWVLTKRGSLVSIGLSQEALLMVLAVLASLGLGVAATVALCRMLLAGGIRSIGFGEALYRVFVAGVALTQIALPVNLLVALGKGTDPAGLRLFCARVTRLVNGVTPMVPMLLLSLTGGIILLGDWRRVGMRIRMNSTGTTAALDSGPLAKVWQRFSKAREVLDHPLSAWRGAGFLMTLPLWALLSLSGICFAQGLPTAVEPYPLFLPSFLLAFGVTLGLLVVRLVDLFGLSRVLDLLLRRLAEVPMLHAFDRVPAHFVHENFWRPNSLSKKAEDDSDPRLDRQFEAVAVGFQANRDAIQNDGRLGFVAADRLEQLIATFNPSEALPIRDWWPAVGALAPFLVPYWSARPAIPTSPADDAAEWVGLTDPNLMRWLRSAEDLIAMVMVRQIAWLRAAVNSILSFLVVGLVMMTLVLTSYPFEPQGPLFALLGALTVVTVGAIVVIAVQANRDEVLSRLTKTISDRFTFDRQFFTTIVTFVVPLLGLLGALSYSLSDLFRSLLEPFFRAG